MNVPETHQPCGLVSFAPHVFDAPVFKCRGVAVEKWRGLSKPQVPTFREKHKKIEFAFSSSKSCKAKYNGEVKLLQTALEDKISSTCYIFQRCSEDTQAVSVLCLLYGSHLKKDSCTEPWRPQRLKAVIKEKVISTVPRAL